ncbi:MAG: amino acid--tRNA ligase-related protein [Candidatus Roizmanbacteria bacterium]
MNIKTNLDNLSNYKIYLKVEQAVNEFLQKKGYLKVDLPVLSPSLIPESYLEIFETEFRYLDKRQKLYLTPSPELFLKRLLSYGVGSCYYLGKSFRNSDPVSILHSYEFTMLEFYKMGADYMDVANEVLAMLKYIDKKVKNTSQKLKFDKWEKISVAEAFRIHANISEKELFDHELFLKKAKEKGYRTDGFSYEDIWSQVYTSEVEKNLGINGYPTLIFDYPKEFAALAKLNKDGKTTQRFEFYINGIELGDCYTELTEWKEQELRFRDEDLKRKKQKKISHPIDKGYVEALKYGLGNCSGIAIGLERLAMIFAGTDSIKKLKLINIE